MSMGKKLIAITLLGGIGMNRRRRIAALTLSAFGMVAFGAALGAAMGIAFAPSSGRQLRSDMSEKLGSFRSRMKNRREDVAREQAARDQANATP
jgi:hypothetical protein